MIDILFGLVGIFDRFDVQLFGNHPGVLSIEPSLVRRVGQNHFDLGQRLANLQARPFAGPATE